VVHHSHETGDDDDCSERWHLGRLGECGRYHLATGAAAAGVVAYRAYLREEVKDRQAHAAGMHAWLAWDTACDSDGQRLVLLNAGTALVYDVRVRIIINGIEQIAPSRDGTWRVLPPGTFIVQQDPTDKWGFPEPADSLHRYRPYTRSANHLVTGIEFADARGVRWRRDRTGRLAEDQTDYRFCWRVRALSGLVGCGHPGVQQFRVSDLA